jgi:ABC-2 type transport system ATP-binding protein
VLRDGQSIDPVVDLLHARGLKLRHLVEKRQTLEDLFVATVEAAEPGIDAAPRPRPKPTGGAERVKRPQDGVQP